MLDYQKAKGYLRPEERNYLYNMAARYPTILNIGVEYGASVVCLFQGNPNAFIDVVDINLKPFEEVRRQIGHVLSSVIEGDSSKQTYTDDYYHIIFIDGDHSYDGVKKDIEATQNALASYGWIMFHDCYDYDDPTVVHRVCPGVNQAVSEWYDNNREAFEEHRSIGTMRVFRRRN